jgi:exonuclease SbcC
MRNFLAVGDEPVEIIFTTVGGITLIKGNNQDVSGKSSNGSGKSTIIEAIFFGLTGSTLRKLNLEGILHNKKSGECVVEIEFDNVKIVRTISPKGKGGCKLDVDGVPVTTASIKETNKLVDEYVGLNFETLSNILIFGQHNIVSFLEAGEGEKREIIENLMNLREYNQYEENAKELLKQAKAAMKTLADRHGVHSKYLQEQKALLDKQKSILFDYRIKLTSDISVLNGRIAAMPDIEQLRELWRNYTSYVDTKNKLEENIHSLVEKRNQLQSEYNTAVATKQKESQGKQPLIDRLNQVKAKATVLEERKRQLWQEKVVPIGIEIERNEGIIANFRCEIARQIDSIRANESFDWQKSTVEKQIKQQKDRILHLNSHGVKDGETCPTCYGQVDSSNLRNLVSVIEGEISQLETQLTTLRQQSDDEANRVRQERAKLEKQLEKTDGESQIQIADLTAKMKEAEEMVKTQASAPMDRGTEDR